MTYIGEGTACQGYNLNNLTPEALCIRRQTDDRQGPCKGDSGGPAFFMDGGQFVQVGVVSAGRTNSALRPGIETLKTQHSFVWALLAALHRVGTNVNVVVTSEALG